MCLVLTQIYLYRLQDCNQESSRREPWENKAVEWLRKMVTGVDPEAEQRKNAKRHR